MTEQTNDTTELLEEPPQLTTSESDESEERVLDEITPIRSFMEATPNQVTDHIFELSQQYPHIAKRVYLKLACVYGGPTH